MKACRCTCCTCGELGFGDDSFRFRVGNALLKHVPYSAAFSGNVPPRERAARRIDWRFSVKNHAKMFIAFQKQSDVAITR
jgi:hypothetical protein